METKVVQDFYNTNLKKNEISYEDRRWFESSQKKAGYLSTKDTIEKYMPLAISGSSNVLEIGPGPGTWTRLLLKEEPKANYDLVDISEEMLGQAKKTLAQNSNINFIVSDVLDFVPQKKYDFFFSSRMIEYVPDKSKLFSKISDSLNVGAKGFVITKTPQYNRPFSRKRVSDIHNFQISLDDLKSILKDSGLEVEVCMHATYVFPVLKMGFLDRVLYHLFKSLPFKFGSFLSESYAVVFRKI